MQLYALEREQLINANGAEKGKEYTCPECNLPVRVRKGTERRAHYFHPKAPLSCRLSQKGIIHLQLQLQLKSLLTSEEAVMEKIFPSINRIADIACLRTKKVLEVQYSPMSLEEAKARCRDYESLGYEVIWILHDHTYNQRRVNATERFLRTKTCYYTNMDEEGIGEIYDQFEQIRSGQRYARGSPQTVDLTQGWPAQSSFRPTWSLSHVGDLIDLHQRGELPEHWETSPPPEERTPRLSLKNVYLTLLDQLLDRCST